MKIINLYFVRHGQTEWNLQHKLQGSKNSPLTSKGIEDAKLTGSYLSNIKFSVACSSPQPRAIETRDYILSKIHNADEIMTRIIPGIDEMDYGSWEGLYIDELKKLNEFQIFLHDAVLFDGKSNQGEDYKKVLERGIDAINKIIDDLQYEGNILIVSHGNFIRLILCHLSGKNWQQHRDDNYFPKIFNASISRIVCEIDGTTGKKTFKLKSLNRVEHLN